MESEWSMPSTTGASLGGGNNVDTDDVCEVVVENQESVLDAMKVRLYLFIFFVSRVFNK